MLTPSNLLHLPTPHLQVSDVDMRHKLNTFIVKNPPENKLSKEERRCACL